MKKFCIFTLCLLAAFKVNAAAFYINPGHGGYDSNDRPTPLPMGLTPIFYESDGNTDRSLALRDILQSMGHSCNCLAHKHLGRRP